VASLKGVIPFHLNQYLLSNFGEDGLGRVCAGLSPSAAQMLRTPVAHQWYPHADFLAAEEQACKLFYGGNYAEAWRFGAYNMEESIAKVYRFLFRFLSPELLMQKSAKLWSTFMDTGRLEFQSLGTSASVMRAIDVRPASTIWCHEMRGALLGALSVCKTPEGQRSVTETECVFRGGTCCRFESRW